VRRSACILALALAAIAGAATAQQSGVDRLHDALKLVPAQDAAWAAYRASIPDPARAEQRRSAASKMYPTLPTPRRMDLVEAEMAAELAELRRESAALKRFYATLTPEQQQLFDQRTLAPPPADD
jgi:hypothetical protein